MVAVYLDGANLAAMVLMEPRVSGFTTNPSLMKQAGVDEYKNFALTCLMAAKGKPISFEVFSDDMDGMEAQAREIASWGDNVYVKIPCTNTKAESTALLIRKLSAEGIMLNVTAVMTFDQINNLARCLHATTPSILSIFCGRIADTGRDPVPFITQASRVKHAETKILWASTREVLNFKQAQSAGADIITMTPDLIKKLDLSGKDLALYSLETVRQFFEDAKGLTL